MTAVPLGRRAAILFASLGIATLDWGVRLIRSEQVGGRAHESQCIRFVWGGGGAA
jgi:hypothetical protein